MRSDKTLLLKEIKDKIDTSQAMVFATYAKMSPNMAASFRTDIDKSGGTFEVVKKRVLMKAAEVSGFSLDRELLQGHIGVIFAQKDPVETTKCIYRFSEENADILEVLGGRFEGALYSAKDIELISQLPTKDQMRSQFLGLLEAPMAQTLAVVEALLCSVPICLANKAEQDQ